MYEVAAPRFPCGSIGMCGRHAQRVAGDIRAAKARKMGQSALADKAADFAIGDAPAQRPGGTGKEIIQVAAAPSGFVCAGGPEEIAVFAITPARADIRGTRAVPRKKTA